MIHKFGILSATLVLGMVSPAQAAEKTYLFSGVLTSSYQFSDPIPEWKFAVGQRFSGKLVYDSSAVGFSYDYINTPGWQLTFHNSPIVSMSFQIEMDGGTYAYDVPTQNLSNAAWTYAAIAKAGNDPFAWAGVQLRTHNYPVGWTANPPSMPVPANAYVGPYNPHSTYLTLADSAYWNPDVQNLMANTSADQDLAKLFSKIVGSDANFSIRFSDSSKWQPGVERIDAILDGRFDSFIQASGVPEGPVWMMMLTGFGLLGGALRQRKTTLTCA